MANFTLSFSLFFCIVLNFTFNLGGNMAQDAVLGQKTWCVAKPSADAVVLGQNIQYACNQVGIDCSIIQEGGQCFYPNNIINQASVVMNLYYQQAGPAPVNCNFANTGLIAVTDPSYGACVYYSM